MGRVVPVLSGAGPLHLTENHTEPISARPTPKYLRRRIPVDGVAAGRDCRRVMNDLGDTMMRKPQGLIGLVTALAAALVTCTPIFADYPAGKEIAEVILQGNRIHTREQIFAQIDTKTGSKYDPKTALEDVNRLLALGWFPPSGIGVSTQIREDGKVVVYFNVQELQNTIKEIVYRGAAHLSKDELDKQTNLKTGMPMNPAVVQQARQAILRKYQEQGRNWATVTILEGNNEQDTRVVFDIGEGPKTKIGSIDFEYFGPSTGDISSARLRVQITSSRAYLGTLIGGDYSPVIVEQDIAKIGELYHNLGYLDVRVQRELIWSEKNSSVKVVFHIEEGPRYKVANLRIEGNKNVEEVKLLSYTDIHIGDYYSRPLAKADQERIRNFYGYQGRPVTVRETVNQAGDGLVNVHYEVEEKEPVRVGDVLIYGNSVTRDNVIRRELNLYPGQILSYPDLIDAKNRLKRLGIFEDDPTKGIEPTVEVEHPELTDQPYKNILVKVQEKPTGSFMVGAGVTSDAGLTGSIVLNERNFDITRLPTSWDDILEGRAWRGADQEFRIEAVPGTQLQRYTASWREPAFLDSNYSIGASGYYFTRQYNEYDESRFGARFTVGRRLDNFWSINATSRIEDVNITNVYAYEPTQITNYAGHSTLIGERLGVMRDERDSVLRPSKGDIFEIGAEWVTGTYNYPLATAEFKEFWTLWNEKDGSGKQVLSFRSQVSWAGSNTPVYERFYAGGFDSLRGFAFRGVGPFIDNFNIGGNFAFLNSLEYQIPIMAGENLYFVTFIDSGTVEEQVTIKDYRVAAGVGLRIAIPQLLGPMPIALDFATPITRGPGDKSQLFSFFLGFYK